MAKLVEENRRGSLEEGKQKRMEGVILEWWGVDTVGRVSEITATAARPEQEQGFGKI